MALVCVVAVGCTWLIGREGGLVGWLINSIRIRIRIGINSSASTAVLIYHDAHHRICSATSYLVGHVRLLVTLAGWRRLANGRACRSRGSRDDNGGHLRLLRRVWSRRGGGLVGWWGCSVNRALLWPQAIKTGTSTHTLASAYLPSHSQPQ